MWSESSLWRVPSGIGFFFKAEEGIRDHCVTGVQTCALPIYEPISADRQLLVSGVQGLLGNQKLPVGADGLVIGRPLHDPVAEGGRRDDHRACRDDTGIDEIGRASCRERV